MSRRARQSGASAGAVVVKVCVQSLNQRGGGVGVRAVGVQVKGGRQVVTKVVVGRQYNTQV